jgi:uncharacterized protein (TIGR04551 family)
MMQTRFRPVFVALGSLLLAKASLAQEPAPAKPAQPAKPAPAAPAPAAKPAPAAPAAAPAKPAPAAPAAKPAPAAGAKPAPAAKPAPVAPADAAPAAAPIAPAAEEAPPAEETEPPAGHEHAEPLPALPPPSDAATRPRALPAFPEPAADAAALQRMGRDRPPVAKVADESDVFADDWWSHARPILELHGNFRVRAEMYYRFSLGRVDEPKNAIWPRPPDSPYGSYPVDQPDAKLCTEDESGTGSSTSVSRLTQCSNNTQAGANLRFRLNPEIHVSDNLRVISQIDLLDNLVLGSTPSPRNGYEPIGFNAQSTDPSLANSIRVKRVWGEYSTPVGELRFGRMPNHWGLGIVNNSGDGYDGDYQSTIDRLQFVAGIKPLELYISGAWDFPNEGQTNAALFGETEGVTREQTQAYDLAQLDDVDQYVVSVTRRKSPELTKLALTRGNLVINGGLQLTYRKQLLAAEFATMEANTDGTQYVRRDAHYWLPDIWLQLLYKGFRFEAEAATYQGSVGNNRTATGAITDDDKYTIAQWGFAAELEQKLVENRLRLGLSAGWASGDADVDGLVPTNGDNNFGQLGGDHTISTFRFNPAYRNDLILSRNILSRVQGTYYFRPSLGYDFLHDAAGQRLGGQVAGIWTRASQFIQAPGHDRDLGLELNGAVYFQAKDGALNDDPTQMGGFYARLEYGILFPMAGMGYPSGTATKIKDETQGSADVSSAQILRLYLGVLF